MRILLEDVQGHPTRSTLAATVNTGLTLLVANPTARSGKAKRSIDVALDTLANASLEPEFMATLPEGRTVAALAERLEVADVARVVYMGGDGTFAEAAKGIILARERSGVDVPLGMLPMGTANDQGRSFGICAGARSLARNVSIIAAGIEQWLDVGRVQAFDELGRLVSEDLWFDSFGLGMSAQVLFWRNRDKEWIEHVPFLRRFYRNKLVYAGATIRALVANTFAASTFSLSTTIDGHQEHYVGVTDVLVQGTILYAGDWIFDVDAKPDDGRFEVVILQGAADWAGAAIGGHKRNPVTDDDLAVLGLPRRKIPRGRSIALSIKRSRRLRGIRAQIDGEEFASTDHYRIENLFNGLRVIVPADAHWI